MILQISLQRSESGEANLREASTIFVSFLREASLRESEANLRESESEANQKRIRSESERSEHYSKVVTSVSRRSRNK